MYGGTFKFAQGGEAAQGLSPRVRGNRIEICIITKGDGSIPACTGEPSKVRSRTIQNWVYPRVYGGTSEPISKITIPPGLSPRVRGNPFLTKKASEIMGSIPACTGEPAYDSALEWVLRVYPRVYGGTRMMSWRLLPSLGLSPRVRGNRRNPSVPYGGTGSIPACTGEPSCGRIPCNMWRVYPRVYGGTTTFSVDALLARGLSPRVRGNLM